MLLYHMVGPTVPLWHYTKISVENLTKGRAISLINNKNQQTIKKNQPCPPPTPTFVACTLAPSLEKKLLELRRTLVIEGV